VEVGTEEPELQADVIAAFAPWSAKKTRRGAYFVMLKEVETKDWNI